VNIHTRIQCWFNVSTERHIGAKYSVLRTALMSWTMSKRGRPGRAVQCTIWVFLVGERKHKQGRVGQHNMYNATSSTAAMTRQMAVF
jgi:hypothetical protein